MPPMAALRTKATTARQKGAVAIIFVNEEGDKSDILDPFRLDRLGQDAGIICLQARRTPLAKIFPKTVPTLYVAEKDLNKKKKANSFELPHTTMDVESSIEFITGQTYNLVGMVDGTDDALKNEYVIVGAHYDHLGMGTQGSLHKGDPAIHYGADDNASGTAALIELANRIKKNPTKRSVVFMAFSGEERGLLGSKYWVSHPTIPLDQVAAMINMDMVGRLKDNKLNVHGTGTSKEWKMILDSAISGTEIKLAKNSDGFGPSDHASFVPKGIPALHFFTGLHTDYHKPSDTWDKTQLRWRGHGRRCRRDRRSHVRK